MPRADFSSPLSFHLFWSLVPFYARLTSNRSPTAFLGSVLREASSPADAAL